jgi:putative copper export protein/mono/diheme cytochrome c family protein
MNVFLKAVHCLTLCLALGGPLFWTCIWGVLDTPDSRRATLQVWQRVRIGIWLGAVCFLVSGAADLVRAAHQVIDPTDLESLLQFLLGTRYGNMTLFKILLMPLFLLSVFWLPTSSPRLAPMGAALCGLALLTSISLTSHAAAKPGLIPVLSETVHLAGVVVWGGGLLYFALLPWKTIRQETETYGRLLWKLVERFSTIALVAVCLLVVSGVVLAFLHVYGLPAFSDTPYGRILSTKIAVFLLTLGVAAWQLLRLSPALKRQARTRILSTAYMLLGRCAILVRTEAALILGVILLAAVLTTLPPAERPAQVTRAAWDKTLDGWHLQLTMTPRGDRGQVQFDIALTPVHDQQLPHDLQLFVYLRMRDHDMGTLRRAAVPIAVGHYTTRGLISMAGAWEVDITLQPPGAASLTTTFAFTAATGTLDQDRNRRLEPAAIWASWLAMLSCLLGLLLGALAVVTLWASRSGRMPGWATPFGFCLMVGGGYLVLRVVLVDAYPTTYLANPIPSTPEAIVQGQNVFQQHCAVCHGHDGHGDGPAAVGLNPRPADLTAAHVDDHTDGDLFWWLTHGIAGTAMPPWQEQLSEPERWMVVHYIRSLRRGRL